MASAVERAIRELLPGVKPAKGGYPKSHNTTKHAALMQAFEKAVQYRRPLEESWIANILYGIGQQNSNWNSQLGLTQRHEIEDPYRVRMIANIIRPLITKRISKMMRAVGKWGVMPSTLDPEDRSQAESDQQWLTYAERQGKLKTKKGRLATWVVYTGNGGDRPDHDGRPLPRLPGRGRARRPPGHESGEADRHHPDAVRHL